MARLSTRTSRQAGQRQRGSGRPPASDGEQTRLRILEAARICFGEHGYRETSNWMIADAVSLTPGTIYHYFENKRDLFLAAHEFSQRDILAHNNASVEGASTFREALEKLLQSMGEVYDRHPDYAKFNSVVRTEARRNPEISSAQADQEWRHLYHRMTDLGVATGEIDHRDARRVRNVLALIVLGGVQFGIEASQADRHDMLQGVLQLFDNQLVGPPKRTVRDAN